MISYNVYWIFVISCFLVMRFKEVKGHWPFMKAKAKSSDQSEQDAHSDHSGTPEGKVLGAREKAVPS